MINDDYIKLPESITVKLPKDVEKLIEVVRSKEPYAHSIESMISRKRSMIFEGQVYIRQHELLLKAMNMAIVILRDEFDGKIVNARLTKRINNAIQDLGVRVEMNNTRTQLEFIIHRYSYCNVDGRNHGNWFTNTGYLYLVDPQWRWGMPCPDRLEYEKIKEENKQRLLDKKAEIEKCSKDLKRVDKMIAEELRIHLLWELYRNEYHYTLRKQIKLY